MCETIVFIIRRTCILTLYALGLLFFIPGIWMYCENQEQENFILIGFGIVLLLMSRYICVRYPLVDNKDNIYYYSA